MSDSIPFHRNRLLQLTIIASLLFWGIMAISPTDRSMWLVENILVAVLAIALVWSYRAFHFSNLSYMLIALFLCLHTYAAHYTYQGTPIDIWLKAAFHTKRSYYDRAVHFAFGLFMAYPFRELLTRLALLRGFWSYAIPTTVVLSFSALFEIVEMAAAGLAGQGQYNEQFIGMQGDLFDTQKDMLLGFSGGVLSMGLLAWIIWRSNRTEGFF
jgi:putative membrane protein